MSGGDSYQPDETLQNELAQISRDQWGDYVTDYQPIEKQLLNVANGSDMNAAVGEAQAISRAQMDNAASIRDRQFERAGVNLDPRQKQAVDRNHNLSAALNESDVANRTRIAEKDRQLASQERAIELGRNIQSDATGTMGNASAIQQASEAVKANNAAAEDAQRTSMIGTGIGAAIAFAPMLAASSKKLKKNIKNVKPAVALKRVNEFDQKDYEYKSGRGLPSGEKTGGIAEDMPDNFTNEQKTAADVYGMISNAMGAIQAIDSRMKRLEGKQL